jgi:hypothetical protein
MIHLRRRMAALANVGGEAHSRRMAAARDLPPGVIEHDGMLWTGSKDSSTSAEEFIAARTLFMALNEDAMWNPWVREERKADIDRAGEVMATWERAEPGHRRLTMRQWEARQARQEKERTNERQEVAERQERDKARYDELRVAGATHPLNPRESAELAAVLVGTEDHPWPHRLTTRELGRFSREPVEITRVAPTVVVEVEADTAFEHGRWRHLTRYRRVRLDL